MFIINESTASASVAEFNGYVPEITDYSDDSVNIMEASMFFDEGVSKIVRATAMAEVAAYNEDAIEAFEEGVGHTILEKIKKLWEKFKAFLGRVRDNFMAWFRKTFSSNGAFLRKYSKVIKDNIKKLDLKNPSFDVPDFVESQNKFDAIDKIDTDKVLETLKEDELKEVSDKAKEELKDAVEEFDNTIDNTSSVRYKEIPSDIKKMLEDPSKTESILKAQLDEIKKEADKYEPYVKNATKTDDHNVNATFESYKLKKEQLTKLQSALIKLNKAKLRAVTKIAYAAVKLQHTNRDDIKEESASLSMLDKYLERI